MFALAILLLEMWIISGFRSIFGIKLDAEDKYNSGIEELRDSGIEKLEGQSEKELKSNILATDAHRHAQTKERDIFPDDAVREKPSAASQLKDIHSDNAIDSLDGEYPATRNSQLATRSPQTQEPATRNPQPVTPWLKAILQPPQFIVAVLLLGATLVLAQGVEFREKIPMSRSFSEFPLQVGEWTGKRDVLELKFIEELDFKDYIIVDYRDKAGKAVNFYTAYYDTQRKGESIHSPETCLPGGGWEFKRAGRTTVPMNPSDMTINRAFIVQGAAKQLTYYWFPLRDRIATNLWEVKAYNFWDALTRQRTDGALVRLVTPVYKDENVADADERLAAFTREIVPVLKEFLPR